MISGRKTPSLTVPRTLRKASYHWDADIFPDKEKLFRKRDNRPATKTVLNWEAALNVQGRGEKRDEMQRKTHLKHSYQECA